MNRRRLLQVALAGGGVLALSGVALSFQSTKMVPLNGLHLQVLTHTQYSILVALANQVIGPGSVTAQDVGVAAGVDALLVRMHPADVGELLLLLALIENPVVGLLAEQRARPFSMCSSETQAGILESWRTSAISLRRTGYRAMAGLCLSVYWSSDLSWPSCGYDGPPIGA